MLILPQYADSLMPQHVQQFQDGMKQVRSIWDALVAWYKRIMPPLMDIINTLAKVLAPVVPRRARYSRQSRQYLSVKQRAILRTRRYAPRLAN